MATIPVTTADVAASPTAEELLPHWSPLKQPDKGDQHPVDRGLEDAPEEICQ